MALKKSVAKKVAKSKPASKTVKKVAKKAPAKKAAVKKTAKKAVAKKPVTKVAAKFSESKAQELSTQIIYLMVQIDSLADDLSFLDGLSNKGEVLMGTTVARAYLDGYVEISAKTIPYLERTLKTLQKVVKEIE